MVFQLAHARPFMVVPLGRALSLEAAIIGAFASLSGVCVEMCIEGPIPGYSAHQGLRQGVGCASGVQLSPCCRGSCVDHHLGKVCWASHILSRALGDMVEEKQTSL